MSQVTMADITKLRKLTGAGMMDCKNALSESNCEIEKAIEIIRKKGLAVAMKRADRETSEGLVVTKVNPNGKDATIVAISCETDFVAKTEGFVQLANTVLEIAYKEKPENTEDLKLCKSGNITVNDLLLDKIAAIGEKIEIAYYQNVNAEHVFSYIHQGSKLGVLVGFNKMISDTQVGKDIAMQTAAMNPIAIDKNDVSKEIVDKEIEIGKEQARKDGKPEEMLEKIALGKLNKFYNESTLLNQEFVKEGKISVRQYLQNYDKELTVTVFKRISLTL